MQHPSKWLVMAALWASTLLGIAACRPMSPAPFRLRRKVCDANTEYCLQVSENGSEEGMVLPALPGRVRADADLRVHPGPLQRLRLLR